MNFTTNYTCPLVIDSTDYYPPFTLQYKYNATDPDGLVDESSVAYFDIEKDDVTPLNITPSPNNLINRTEQTDFLAFVNDSDVGDNVTSLVELARIYVSFYSSTDTFDNPAKTDVDASGLLNRSLENSDWCADTKYYLGQNYWRV